MSAYNPQVIEATNKLLATDYPRARTAYKGYLAQTYLWIYLYYNCYKRMPSHEDIGRHFGISEVAAHKRVLRLIRLGYVRQPFGKHRAIELVGVDAA